MGIFKKKVKATPLKELKKYHGKAISYAVERINGQESNLGKNGGISVTDDEIVVLCDGHQVFRCNIKGAVIAQLMSGNGCDIKGIDSQTNKKRHIVCFYSIRPHS
ncbi:MAG: hypothetical protein GX896_01740 [Clostridiales bacterium]|nr:hypothetical protein [Clostridiales bacterium]